nr:hypothetical protein [Clostridia bacterium]
MATYIGKRIVPIHCGKWEKNRGYEMLSIVLEENSGDSYIARRMVPAGTDISDTYYWMLHSLFSQQIKDMSDQLTATEERIVADNDETEASIKADNRSTRDHVDESLQQTTRELTERVTSAQTAMTQQKASFDEQAAQLNTRMDAVLAAGTGTGETEILDARVDDTGKQYETLGNHLRSIYPRALDGAGDVFSRMMGEQYAAGILEKEQLYLHKGDLSYQYNTSTFSGWVSKYEMPVDVIMTGLKFIVRARTEAVTNIRLVIAEDKKDEAIVFEDNLEVNVEPETTGTISASVPALHFSEGQIVYICVECNQICTQGFGNSSDTEVVTWYATEGRKRRLEDYASGTRIRLYMEMFGFKPGAFETDALRERMNTAEQDILSLNKSADRLDYLCESFDEREVLDNQQDPLPVANPKLKYDYSTFYGWAFPIGKVQDFDTAVFTIHNRDTEGYIESVRCIVAVEDRAGEILIDETQTGFHIAPDATEKITFIFSKPIENAEGKNLYFAYECDYWNGIIGGDTIANLNPPDYGVVCYSSGSTPRRTKMEQELRRWTTIYDPGVNNKFKADVLFGKQATKYLFGDAQQDFIREVAQEAIGQTPGLLPPRVILPDLYHAVVGDTLQLFFRGFVEHPDPYFFNIEVKCDIGKNTARYYEVTPTEANVGDHTLIVNIRDNRDNILATASCKLRVHSVKNSPSTEKRILCIGDSLTSAGNWCKEAMRRLTESGGTPAGLGLSNIRFVGTKKNGACGYEGYGGWTWGSYLGAPSKSTLGMWVYGSHDKDSNDQHSLWKDAGGNIWSMETIETERIKFTRYENHTADMPIGAGKLTYYQNGTHTADINYDETVYAEGNPFWDSDEGQVNFQTYCERNGFGGIDYVYTLLTWNGLGGYYPEADSTAIANHVASAKRLLRILHEQYPSAKVKMMGIQLPSVNGGCGQSYGASSVYSNWYGLVRSVMGMNIAYQQMAHEDEFRDYVEFINVSGQFDSEYNMPRQSKPVNTRCTTTEQVGTNGVHPSLDGYYQIGDAAFRSMVGELTE